MPKPFQKIPKTFLKGNFAWGENRYLLQVANGNFCPGCSTLNTNKDAPSKIVNNQSIELFKKALKI